MYTQRKPDIHPILYWLRVTVFDSGPTITHYRVNVSRFLGILIAQNCSNFSLVDCSSSLQASTHHEVCHFGTMISEKYHSSSSSKMKWIIQTEDMSMAYIFYFTGFFYEVFFSFVPFLINESLDSLTQQDVAPERLYIEMKRGAGSTLRSWDVGPMLGVCWTSVEDDGSTLTQHWANVSCLLGCVHVTLRLRVLSSRTSDDIS